jgi:hypothetical protein
LAVWTGVVGFVYIDSGIFWQGIFDGLATSDSVDCRSAFCFKFSF